MDAVEENIRNRRSIRKYSDKEIPDEYVDKLLRAAMQAAGSRMGSEPWEFIVVKDKDIIKKLSELLIWKEFIMKEYGNRIWLQLVKIFFLKQQT